MNFISEAFKIWQEMHGKSYDNSDDHQEAHDNWKDNNEYINHHNHEYHQGNHLFSIGHNKYSDLAADVFSRVLKGFDANQHAHVHDSSRFNLRKDNIPESVDWREQGAVNEVQDQGQCGCCYAFSAVAAIEAQYFKQNGKLVKLSEQNVVDCSTQYGNNGGNRGTMDNVFTYIQANGGIDTEVCYPYQAQAGSCQYNPRNSVGNIVASYVDIPEGDENALAAAVAQIGPISVGIDASRRSFQLYKTGIYYDPHCSQTPDHAVVIVGYGSDGSGQDYWIVRNSWGPSWGENGYIKMARNRGNAAGIANMASYPVLTGSGANSGGNGGSANDYYDDGSGSYGGGGNYDNYGNDDYGRGGNGGRGGSDNYGGGGNYDDYGNNDGYGGGNSYEDENRPKHHHHKNHHQREYEEY